MGGYLLDYFLAGCSLSHRYLFPPPQVSPLPPPHLTNQWRMNSSNRLREERAVKSLVVAAAAMAAEAAAILFTQHQTPTLPRRARPGWAAATTSGSFQSRRSCMPSCGAWARRVKATPTARLATTTTARWASGRAASVAPPCSAPCCRRREGAMGPAPSHPEQPTIRFWMGRGRRARSGCWCQKSQNRSRGRRRRWWYHPRRHQTARRKLPHHPLQRKRRSARLRLAHPRPSSTCVPTPPPARRTPGETERQWVREEGKERCEDVARIRLTVKCRRFRWGRMWQRKEPVRDNLSMKLRERERTILRYIRLF